MNPDIHFKKASELDSTYEDTFLGYARAFSIAVAEGVLWYGGIYTMLSWEFNCKVADRNKVSNANIKSLSSHCFSKIKGSGVHLWWATFFPDAIS